MLPGVDNENAVSLWVSVARSGQEFLLPDLFCLLLLVIDYSTRVPTCKDDSTL